MGSYERYQGEAGNPFAKGSDFRATAGVDGKIGITNNLTLDFTVFPDFGQVEADPSEVNLTAYETFFQERRPFFIEGRNITSFRVGIGDGDLGNDNLFYSRRIGRRPQLYPSLDDGEYGSVPRQARILGAVKLTGKTAGGLSIGVVEAITAEEKAEIDNEGERTFQTVEPLTNYFVTRVQKDFNKGNTMLGGVFTNVLRNFDETEITSMHKTARSGGIDFTQYWGNKNYMATATVAISQVNGPAMRLPGYNMLWGSISSDTRKKLIVNTSINYRMGNEGYSSFKSAGILFTYRPVNTLSLRLNPTYSVSGHQLQYVTRQSYNDETRYIMATLSQRVLSLSLRVNYNITPDLSVEYWGQPFLAAAAFSNYKMVTSPMAEEYSERFHTYDPQQISYNTTEKRYYIDENRDGTNDYRISDPDFNSDAFLSNLVVRWEFSAGSTIFLVWSQSRDYYEQEGAFNIVSNVNNLFTSKKPYDVFLIKFSYRFGLR